MSEGDREEWRAIGGAPLYEVSNFGRVRRKGGRVLKPSLNYGYQQVAIKFGSRFVTTRVHKMVIETFCGPRPSSRHQAAHNDGSRENNRASNLRWALPEENQADRILHGTDLRGSEISGAVLSEENIPVIRRLREQHVPLSVIARAFMVSESTISLVALGKTWRHAA